MRANRPAIGEHLRWLAVGGLIAISVSAVALGLLGPRETGWLVATRWTARASLLFFVATMLVPTSWASRVGMAFAGSHIVHAGALCIYLVLWPTTRSWLSTIGGAIGYAVIFALILTTLRPNTSIPWLRSWGMGYLWIVFFASYLTRALEDGPRQDEGLFGLAILIGTLIILSVRRLGRT